MLLTRMEHLLVKKQSKFYMFLFLLIVKTHQKSMQLVLVGKCSVIRKKLLSNTYLKLFDGTSEIQVKF